MGLSVIGAVDTTIIANTIIANTHALYRERDKVCVQYTNTS